MLLTYTSKSILHYSKKVRMSYINTNVDEKIYRMFLNTVFERNKKTRGIRTKALEVAMLNYIIKYYKYRSKPG